MNIDLHEINVTCTYNEYGNTRYVFMYGTYYTGELVW